MAIISLGTIDKKLLIPLAYIIINIFTNIYWLNQEYNIITLFIEGFGYSIGQIITIFLRSAFKYNIIEL